MNLTLSELAFETSRRLYDALSAADAEVLSIEVSPQQAQIAVSVNCIYQDKPLTHQISIGTCQSTLVNKGVIGINSIVESAVNSIYTQVAS